MQPRILSTILVTSSLLVATSAHAGPKQLHRVDLSTPLERMESELSTQAIRALIGGDYEQALTIADVGVITDPGAPWPHYERAVALVHLGASAEADAEFLAAQARFPAEDRWGRSVAIYGRAHALAEAGRCEQADRVFEEYAAFVRKDDPEAAAMALSYESDCRLPQAPTRVSARHTRVLQAQRRPQASSR